MLLLVLMELCIVMILAGLAMYEMVLLLYAVLIRVCRYGFSLWLTDRELRAEMTSGKKANEEAVMGYNYRCRCGIAALFGFFCVVVCGGGGILFVKVFGMLWPLPEVIVAVILTELVFFAAIVSGLQRISDFENHVNFFVDCGDKILVDGNNPAPLPISDEDGGTEVPPLAENNEIKKPKRDSRKGASYFIGVRITRSLGFFLRDASEREPIYYTRALS